MSKKEKKEKEDKITFKRCKKELRPDGLQMKCVLGYTFPDFVEAVSSRWPERIAYSVFRDDTSEMTFSQLAQRARSVASYLLKLGYEKGDKVALFGESCPNWMVMYLGITYIGCIAVPILPDFSEKEANSILDDCKVKGICLNQKAYGKVSGYIKENSLNLFRMEDLMHLPLSDDLDFVSSPGFLTTSCKYKMEVLKSHKPSESDIASMIYTSGTTGSSKSVMLTHMNILRCADLSTDVYVKIKPGYNVLSILPISHVYEFTIGQVLPMMKGAHITFLGKPPAVSVMMPALKQIRPQIMLSVPLLIEKIYKAAIVPVLTENKRIKKLIKSPLKWYVYRTMGKKLLATFGHRLKFFGIGGAKLDPEVEKFLHMAHFPYALGYGLTETSPLIAGCPPKYSEQKPGWVGKIVADDDVILLDRNENGVGEIAVKGPNVMVGYYNNPDLNSQAFTPDGYFRTGDLGALDRMNRLSIRGRVKTMILGPAGENIYPESIESIINNMTFVQESLVIPEKGGLMALIKLDLKAFADKMKLDVDEAASEAKKYLLSMKKEINKQVSSYSRIDNIELQEEDFERTPTQKIKRFKYISNNSDDKKIAGEDTTKSDANKKGKAVKKANKVERKNSFRRLKKEFKSNKRSAYFVYKEKCKALEDKDKKQLKSAKRALKHELKGARKSIKAKYVKDKKALKI